MEVCYKLWDSWEPDAIVADRVTGVFADPARSTKSTMRASFSAVGDARCFPLASRTAGAMAGRLL